MINKISNETTIEDSFVSNHKISHCLNALIVNLPLISNCSTRSTFNANICCCNASSSCTFACSKNIRQTRSLWYLIYNGSEYRNTMFCCCLLRLDVISKLISYSLIFVPEYLVHVRIQLEAFHVVQQIAYFVECGQLCTCRIPENCFNRDVNTDFSRFIHDAIKKYSQNCTNLTYKSVEMQNMRDAWPTYPG